MKAILLAAGRGTRLRPFTDSIPKCLMPIGGQPLLDIWLDRLSGAGVDEVLINLHHLPDLVIRHLADRPGTPRTTAVYESELLGSAGTLAANRSWVDGEDGVLVCYADVLTDVDLIGFMAAHRLHRANGAEATLALFHSDRPWSCGIVTVDDNGWMTGFREKPARPESDLANAGIYAFHPRVFDEIGGPPPRDIGYDLMPRLVGRAQTVMVEGYLQDIGTIEAYERAQAAWPVRVR